MGPPVRKGRSTCRVCDVFTQLHDAMLAYDASSARLFADGWHVAAWRDEDLACAIDGELHVYDWAGRRDEDILWIEC